MYAIIVYCVARATSWLILHEREVCCIPAGSKEIEKDRNWGMGRDRTFLSLPTHHFASPKLYFFLSPHLSRVTVNIYLVLSLCLVISIFSYPLVFPQYLFLPRNEEYSYKKYCVHFT